MNPLWLLFFWRPFRRVVGLAIFLVIVLIAVSAVRGH